LRIPLKRQSRPLYLQAGCILEWRGGMGWRGNKKVATYLHSSPQTTLYTALIFPIENKRFEVCFFFPREGYWNIPK